MTLFVPSNADILLTSRFSDMRMDVTESKKDFAGPARGGAGSGFNSVFVSVSGKNGRQYSYKRAVVKQSFKAS